MVRGVPTLDAAHVVVKKGETLSAEQAQILKLVGIRMGEFRVRLRFWWEKSTGAVKEVEGGGDDDGLDASKETGEDSEPEGDEDEGMED